MGLDGFDGEMGGWMEGRMDGWMDGWRGRKEGREMGSEGVVFLLGRLVSVSVLRAPSLLSVAFRNFKKGGRQEKHV